MGSTLLRRYHYVVTKKSLRLSAFTSIPRLYVNLKKKIDPAIKRLFVHCENIFNTLLYAIKVGNAHVLD